MREEKLLIRGRTFTADCRISDVRSPRACAYRQRLLLLLVILLGDVQPVDEALQLLAEGFHLGVDAIEQLVLSNPEEGKMEKDFFQLRTLKKNPKISGD